MMSDQTTIYVVDDDQAVRDSLAFLLRTARLRVEEFESATAFLSAAPKIEASCIITDVRMPGLSGIDLLRKLKAEARTIPVIVITGHGDIPLAVEAMKLGAFDFLEKPFNDDALLESVKSALKQVKAAGRRETEKADILARIATLSARERQVLDGLVAGHPNKTIAYDLDISPRTVEIYRANVMTKMAAGSLSELVRMALTAGLMAAD